MGWLYVVLFMLTVAFMLVVFVPEAAWPNKQEFLEKANLEKLAQKSLKTEGDCSEFNEKECVLNMALWCYPSYTRLGNHFLECNKCPKYPTCQMVGKQAACENTPCGLGCVWIVGNYSGGSTINGKCLYDEGLAELNTYLKKYRINVSIDAFDVDFVRETEQYIVFRSRDGVIVLDKINRYIFMNIEGGIIAYKATGAVDKSMQAEAQRVIRGEE